MIIRMDHCRKAGYCSSGVRDFLKTHGVDYMRFLTEGIPQEELLMVTNNDGLVLRVVEVANEQ